MTKFILKLVIAINSLNIIGLSFLRKLKVSFINLLYTNFKIKLALRLIIHHLTNILFVDTTVISIMQVFIFAPLQMV